MNPEAGPGLALVGPRGTGKTTLGRLVADRLGLPFHDADEVIVARHGLSIRQTFEEYGEPGFRDREAAVLADLTAGPAAVIATGGGAVLRGPNRERLRRFGLVIWLTAPADVLAARLLADGRTVDRPALTSAGTLDEIAAVMAEREPWYEETAHFALETAGRHPTELVEVLHALYARCDRSARGVEGPARRA